MLLTYGRCCDRACHCRRAHRSSPCPISRIARDREPGGAASRLPESLIIGADSTMRSNQRRPCSCDAHHDRAAHRMPDGEDRRRTIRQHDLVHQRLEVALVFGKVADMALARIGQRALGTALTAPVESGDSKAAGAQFTHGLEIFLDELGAALEQAHRALAARRRKPARKAHAHAVAGLERAGDHIFGHRIGGDGNEIHEIRLDGAGDGEALRAL